MATLYRIKDWDELFENNRTREMKHMNWVPFPTKLDGDGYTELVDRPNGAAIYGCWCACVIIAGRCGPRGTLLRATGAPHDVTSLARISRLDKKSMGQMLEIAQDVGWIEVTETAPSCENPAPSCPLPNPNPNPNPNPTNSSESALAATEPMSEFVFPVVGSGQKEWQLPSKLLDTLSESYPSVDVAAECRKAVAWCMTNKRKTPSGMPRFLNSWMARQQNSGGGNGQGKSAKAMEVDAFIRNLGADE